MRFNDPGWLQSLEREKVTKINETGVFTRARERGGDFLNYFFINDSIYCECVSCGVEVVSL